MLPPTNILAMRAAANTPRRKAQGGALRLIGKESGSRNAGRMMGRQQSGVLATADRQLAAAHKRLAGMPGAVKRQQGAKPRYERGGRTPQGF